MFKTFLAENLIDFGVNLMEQTSFPSWGYMAFNNLEPATSNTWELWTAPTDGPGMNSRNHHMFSSVSEFIVKGASGISDFSCVTPLTLRPAQVLGITWANTNVMTACGTVKMAYQRTGTLQCVKIPEGRSILNPVLEVVPDMHLSCGIHGGSIASIDFASYGRPEGSCGAFTSSNCDAVGVKTLLETRCVGRSSCVISSQGSSWPLSTCPGPHKLFVQATCTGSHGITVDVTTPATMGLSQVT